MKNNKLYLIAALLGTALTGCQIVEPEIVSAEDPETVVEQPQVKYSFTVEATKGTDTKALSLDGSTLNAYWKNTETVKVFKATDGSASIGTLSVTPGTGEKPTNATLSGAIDIAGLAVDDELLLLIPREPWNYSGQNGTLEGIESGYDYATATVTISSVDDVNNTISASNATFVNQQSIYKFAFSTGSALSVKSFTVSSPTLVQTHTWNGSAWVDTPGPVSMTVAGGSSLAEVYVSLRNTLAGTSTADTYSFSVVGSDDALYTGDKAIPSNVMNDFGQGKYLGTTVTVSKKVLAPAPSGTIDSELLVL